MKHQGIGAKLSAVVTFLIGAVLTITASIFTAQADYLKDLWTQIFSLSIYSIVIGALAVVFSVGLLLAVVRSFTAWTILFSVLMMIVGVLAAVCSIILVTGRTEIRDASFNNTQVLFNNYSNAQNISSTKQLFDNVQQYFKCCGVLEATDWKSKLGGNDVVDSCCRKIETGCGKNAFVDQSKIYLRGCAEPIYARIRSKYTTLMWMNFVLMISAIISTIMGFIFERTVQQGYQTM